MELMKISEAAECFCVSARMLRYYEKMGLFNSSRMEGYAYRVYDEEAIRRLQQILVLRKLRIPVKQIKVILDDENQRQTMEALQKEIEELEEEILALSTIQGILKILVSRLDDSIKRHVRLELLEDAEIMEIIHVLHPPKTNLKEEQTMSELTKANEVLEAKMDIRVVYLPPAIVAASHYVGKSPEDVAKERMYQFIREKNLPVCKPDFRLYGFNNPSPENGQEEYGYEFWVTVPEDMEVEAPMVKKKFQGGLYAAHAIKMGDFHEWGPFVEQVHKSEEYEPNWREPEGMGGALEEELNIYSNILEGKSAAEQLDLLIPIRRKG